MRASVPGVLLVCGEYQVLTPGCTAVAYAHPRRLTVEATPAAAWTIESASLAATPLDLAALAEHPRGKVLAAAIRVARALGAAPHHLIVRSELEDGARKLGLGSSAALSLATLAALHGLDASLYRAACLAHLIAAAGRGSGYELGAQLVGGLVELRSADTASVYQRWSRGEPEDELVNAPWPGLTYARLPLPADLEMRALWTRTPADTGAHVARAQSPPDTEAHTRAFADACRSGSAAGALAALRAADEVMRAWDRRHQVGVFTAAVDAACKRLPGEVLLKPSGAGGGDCVLLCGPPEAVRAARARLDPSWLDLGAELDVQGTVLEELP